MVVGGMVVIGVGGQWRAVGMGLGFVVGSHLLRVMVMGYVLLCY